MYNNQQVELLFHIEVELPYAYYNFSDTDENFQNIGDPCSICLLVDEEKDSALSDTLSRFYCEISYIINSISCNEDEGFVFDDHQRDYNSGKYPICQSLWLKLNPTSHDDFRHCNVKCEIEDDYDKNDYGKYYNSSKGEYETFLEYGECKKINYHYGNCLCGTQKMSFKDAENYSCELGLAWRCQKRSCACGDIQCKKSQICLKPGVCSQ